jgi:hypothetical protein
VTGRIGASQREVQDILATLWQTDVSVGSVGALEQGVSAALAAPVVVDSCNAGGHDLSAVEDPGRREREGTVRRAKLGEYRDRSLRGISLD